MTKKLLQDYSLGWEYISAIFCYFQDCILKNSNSSHIAPKYIYRGISKRYFTESILLNEVINSFIENKAVILNGVDITDNLCDDYITTNEKFKKYAGSFPYNNSHEIVNGLPIDKLKRLKRAEILYKEIYTRLKQKIADRILELESENLCMGNIIQNIELLRDVNCWIENRLTQPEQVRSGASVRLRDVDKKYFSITDYLSYINNLIYDFKKINPEFKDYNELEILAEIQHRGGASCLVDFSKNFSNFLMVCN